MHWKEIFEISFVIGCQIETSGDIMEVPEECGHMACSSSEGLAIRDFL